MLRRKNSNFHLLALAPQFVNTRQIIGCKMFLPFCFSFAFVVISGYAGTLLLFSGVRPSVTLSYI